MSLKKISKIRNGDIYVNFCYYECNRCSTEIPENFPHLQNHEEDYHLCWDCGFIEGKLTENEYIKCIGICLTNLRAEVKDGKIYTWVGKKKPWERNNKEQRNTPIYKAWRTQVFERDNFTCQHCGQFGGELNAHHIKSFAKYKNLRYELANGITLCVDCHRNEHKKSG